MDDTVQRLRSILNTPIQSKTKDKRHTLIDQAMVDLLERRLKLPPLKSAVIASKVLLSARQKRLLVTFSASSAVGGSGAEEALVAARRVTNPFTWLDIWSASGTLSSPTHRKWYTTDIQIEAVRFKRDRPDLWKL